MPPKADSIDRPLVVIEWIDSSSFDGWRDAESLLTRLQDSGPFYVTTAGYLIGETNEVRIVASCVCRNNGDLGAVWTIPIGATRKVHYLQDPSRVAPAPPAVPEKTLQQAVDGAAARNRRPCKECHGAERVIVTFPAPQSDEYIRCECQGNVDYKLQLDQACERRNAAWGSYARVERDRAGFSDLAPAMD